MIIIRTTRRINGKIYKLYSENKIKQQAKSNADSLRRRGYNAVVVKASKNDYFNHRVYIRKVK